MKHIFAGIIAMTIALAPCVTSAPVMDEAKIEAAFHEAEATAALFTGFAGNVYAEGTIDVGGVRYDRFALCDSMTELEERVRRSFTEELAAEILAAVAYEGYPLYVEQDGRLYRFGGYVAQFMYRDSMAEVTGIRAENDVIYVDVESTFDIMDEPMTVSHTYTCVEADGEYRFTGEFALPFEVVYDAWIGRDGK